MPFWVYNTLLYSSQVCLGHIERPHWNCASQVCLGHEEINACTLSIQHYLLNITPSTQEKGALLTMMLCQINFGFTNFSLKILIFYDIKQIPLTCSWNIIS
jgi:hypothetical protein